MQCQARRTARIREDISASATIVNLLSTDRMAKLRNVDANLVRSACFQPAGEK